MSALKTAVELAMAEPTGERLARCQNLIPPMVHALGKNWDQPSVDCIQIDDTHAMMDQAAFDKLANYSHSQPSGVYAGKMWKACYKDGWFLLWFDYSEKGPEWCTTKSRKILIV